MASSKDQVICHVCGFKNEPDAERCVSCGAKLEELSGAYTAEEQAARKPTKPGGFAFQWVAISCVVYLVLVGVALVLLPMVIDAYDPQSSGDGALFISFAIFFAGGILIGVLSPGKTLWEVGVGALLAIGPTLFWLAFSTPDAPERLGGGFQVSSYIYWFSAPVALTLALTGAFLGETIQDRRRRTRA
jgi:hypothetical protein